MVQYVLTPWRDRAELLLVRRQFYADAAEMLPTAPGSERQPSQSIQGDPEQQHQAVARVSMWMQRGNCPHLVESTALLVAAVLGDQAAATSSAGSQAYVVRAAYSAAFSRFVTGLLDSHQDKQRKQSMYSVAKTIGLPATFVELRHQSTHEQLPSLAKLRSSARKALAWIWDYYWKQLGDDEGNGQVPRSTDGQNDGCKEAVLAYLHGDGSESQRRKTLRELCRHDTDRVLGVIKHIQSTLPGNQVYLKCLKLSKDVLTAAQEAQFSTTSREAEGNEGEPTSTGPPVADAAADTEGNQSGWSLYEGPWKPKPIGMI